MKKHKLLFVMVLALFLWQCKETKDAFSITENIKQVYKTNENLELNISNKEDLAIEKVSYYLNDSLIGTFNNNAKQNISLEKITLGAKTLKAEITTDGKTETVETNFVLYHKNAAEIGKISILNSFNHDSKAYTQGLEFFNGSLYESTGQYEKSSLRITNENTGVVNKKIDLDKTIFGEGITILNNKIYQLTWQNNKFLIYNASTFTKEKEVNYFKNMEGWGLTNDGKNLIMSDGTEKIYFLNPNTLKPVKTIEVCTDDATISQINELEFVNGKIWANVYQKDAILVINPKNGAVEKVYDCSVLKTKITTTPETDVLNGIAYKKSSNTFFITGKNWNKMFEIKFD
jgi:glutaminyl-peptide cyclotransferase